VGDEEEARAREEGAEVGVVDGGHDGLAGAGGGDEEVPVAAELAGERDLVEGQGGAPGRARGGSRWG
jgi:hypothetical protein